MHGLNGGEVLLEDLRERAPALGHVTPDPANESNIGVGVTNTFTSQSSRTRASVKRRMPSITTTSAGGVRTVSAARMLDKVIHRLVDRMSSTKLAKLRDQESQSNAFG